MIFSGIDLASAPAKTGAATIAARPSELLLIDASPSATDTNIIERIEHSAVTGLDVPLGWPREFRRFVDKHAAQTLEAPADRRALANRLTDLRAREIPR